MDKYEHLADPATLRDALAAAARAPGEPGDPEARVRESREHGRWLIAKNSLLTQENQALWDVLVARGGDASLQGLVAGLKDKVQTAKREATKAKQEVNLLLDVIAEHGIELTPEVEEHFRKRSQTLSRAKALQQVGRNQFVAARAKLNELTPESLAEKQSRYKTPEVLLRYVLDQAGAAKRLLDEGLTKRTNAGEPAEG